MEGGGGGLNTSQLIHCPQTLCKNEIESKTLGMV